MSMTDQNEKKLHPLDRTHEFVPSGQAPSVCICGLHRNHVAHLSELPPNDNVNSPSHYQSSNGIECIDAIEAALTPEEFRGFLKGNAIKYLWRNGKKDDPEQDAKKGNWYMTRLIAKLSLNSFKG